MAGNQDPFVISFYRGATGGCASPFGLRCTPVDIEPVTASLFGVVLWNDRLAGLQLVGMGRILVMVIARSISFFEQAWSTVASNRGMRNENQEYGEGLRDPTRFRRSCLGQSDRWME